MHVREPCRGGELERHRHVQYDGTAINLTGATVLVRWRGPQGTSSATATIVTPASGIVREPI